MSVGRVWRSCEGGSHQLKLKVEEQQRFHARFAASCLCDGIVAGALPEPALAEIILRARQPEFPQRRIGPVDRFHRLSPFVPFMFLPFYCYCVINFVFGAVGSGDSKDIWRGGVPSRW